MKPLKIFFLFVVLANVFLACKKDEEERIVSKAEVAGVYEGKYGNGEVSPSHFYSFNLKEDGTLQELNSDGSLKGTGTWVMNGATFTATHKYLFPANAFFVSIGTYDASAKKLSGTWGYGNSSTDGGKWYMTRK